MSNGLVNLIVLVAIIAIIAAVISVFVIAATRRGGRKAATRLKSHKSAHRRVNPKTGSLFR